MQRILQRWGFFSCLFFLGAARAGAHNLNPTQVPAACELKTLVPGKDPYELQIQLLEIRSHAAWLWPTTLHHLARFDEVQTARSILEISNVEVNNLTAPEIALRIAEVLDQTSADAPQVSEQRFLDLFDQIEREQAQRVADALAQPFRYERLSEENRPYDLDLWIKKLQAGADPSDVPLEAERVYNLHFLRDHMVTQGTQKIVFSESVVIFLNQRDGECSLLRWLEIVQKGMARAELEHGIKALRAGGPGTNFRENHRWELKIFGIKSRIGVDRGADGTWYLSEVARER